MGGGGWGDGGVGGAVWEQTQNTDSIGDVLSPFKPGFTSINGVGWCGGGRGVVWGWEWGGVGVGWVGLYVSSYFFTLTILTFCQSRGLC